MPALMLTVIHHVWTVALRYLRYQLSALVMSCVIFPAYAELRLEEWKNYAPLAEQGAICASFSALMETQSLLNPDIGTLWQERRKYAGAVIRTAAEMELNRSATEDEINLLVQSYSEWVLDALMRKEAEIDQEAQPLIGQQKMEELIGRHCRVMFAQGDEQILNKNPSLGYLLGRPQNETKTVAAQPATRDMDTQDIPATSPAPVPVSKETQPQAEQKLAEQKIAEDKPAPSAENTEQRGKPKQITLNLGQGTELALNLPSSPAVPQPKKQTAPAERTQTPKTGEKVIADVAADTAPTPVPARPVIEVKKSDAPQPHKHQIIVRSSPQTEIKADDNQPLQQGIREENKVVTDSPVFNTAKSSVSRQSASVIQLGSFAQKQNAEKALNELTARYPQLLGSTDIQIKMHRLSTGTVFFRVETDRLDKGRALSICEILWAARIPCLLKSA